MSRDSSVKKTVSFIDPDTLWYGNGPYIQINTFAQVIKDAHEKLSTRCNSFEYDAYQMQQNKTVLEFGN